MFECSKESGTNLNGFVEVDDDLGGVAGEEHDHYRHQQPRHRVVPPIIYNINIDYKLSVYKDCGGLHFFKFYD